VRAYPDGEAVGDKGLLARIDWLIPVRMADLPGNVSARLFMDAGAIWIKQDTRGGRADLGISNHYELYGAGFGFSWSHPKGLTTTLDVATKIGSNRGNSFSGDDADGRDSQTRAWLGMEWAF
jgi:hemolysin activation/secretion protein